MNYKNSIKLIPIDELRDNIKSPPFQRVINHNRVQELINEYMNEKANKGIIIPVGILIIGCVNNNRYVIDGQHRREAFLAMGEPKEVIIQEIFVDNDFELFQLFKKANNTNPVEHYVLYPVDTQIKSATDKLIKYIQKDYNCYIVNPGKRTPIFPNICIEHFRSIVHLIPGYNEFTENNVIDRFEQFNLDAKHELESSRKAEDIKRLGNAKKTTNVKPLYINRKIVDYLKQVHD